MPYLTPDSIPEDDVCRPLFIPAGSDWLAFFGGALTELTKSYNWQQLGALTVEETVSKMQEIIDAWYVDPCACSTPGGYRVIRIGAGGHIEQLNDLGEWEPSTDEYAIPAPEAREGGTEDNQICLAAKNAVNVLQALYESLSDSWNGDLDEAEAVTALIAVFAGATSFLIAPITWGIVAFMLPIFATMYALLEYLIADLWDEDVSKQIECFLIDCATNTAGVVTFDYDCFYDKLNSLANGFSLSAEQIRLYLQIQYLLYFIGGIDGLNLAGGTTAITDDDCDDCDQNHCFTIDLTVSDGSAYGLTISGGTWVAAEGVHGDYGGTNNYSDTWGYWQFPENLDVYQIGYTYRLDALSGDNGRVGLWALNPIVNYREDFIDSEFGFQGVGDLGLYIDGDLTIEGFGWDINSGESIADAVLVSVVVRYRRSEPIWFDNCPD